MASKLRLWTRSGIVATIAAIALTGGFPFPHLLLAALQIRAQCLGLAITAFLFPAARAFTFLFHIDVISPNTHGCS